jgi:uncharacterized protein (TIGR02186 family)
MRIFCLIFFIIFSFFNSANSASIISGISSNEINIDTNFKGATILLFGAKNDVGNIVIAVRGPKNNYSITKKKRTLGIWHNSDRVEAKDVYSYYSLFSSFGVSSIDSEILEIFELGKNNIDFAIEGTENKKDKNKKDENEKIADEFKLHLIEKFENDQLYQPSAKIDFLDQTLFKVSLNFPKNIVRGVYSVETFLIKDGNLLSFQSIPIYVNQIGFSAKIFDFAYNQKFLYGLITVALALIIGLLVNYLFTRFFGK